MSAPHLTTNPSAEAIFEKFKGDTEALGRQVREFLLSTLEGILEQPDEKANIIGFSYGPGYKDVICTMIFSKKGIKLGFYRGIDLHDPENLLRGSGKVHKYAEISSLHDLGNPGLKTLIGEAIRRYHATVTARKGVL